MDALKSGKELLLKNFETQARKLLQESEQELMKIIDEQEEKNLSAAGTGQRRVPAGKEKII